jgi:hypothetical protein
MLAWHTMPALQRCVLQQAHCSLRPTSLARCVLQDEAKVTEQLLARQAALKLRRGDLERRIRDLGSLPAEAYGDAHRGKSPKQLQRALKQANERLKQCGWVSDAHKYAATPVPQVAGHRWLALWWLPGRLLPSFQDRAVL